MMNKILLYSSLFLIYFVDFSHQIFFILDPFEERCISRQMEAQTSFGGVFYSSGEKEDSNKATIKNSENHIVWELAGQNHGNFNLETMAEGIYSLCLENTANSQLTFSFEFYDEKKDEQLISVNNIENLNTVIHSIRRKLDIIHANMRNSAVRRGAHLEVSNSITLRITFYTAIKIIFVVAFSVFQIMMLTSIFGKNQVQSKITVTQETKGLKSSNSNATTTINENIFL